MGPGHALTGLSAGIAYVALTSPPAWQAPIVIGVTALTAGGPLSPDVDHTPAWRMLDRLLPDELLGEGGPLQHRGISHWWAVPAVAALALWWWAPAWAWLAAAVVLGWATHVVGDFAVGAKSPSRGAGVPILPWTHHVGLGIKCDSMGERVMAPTLSLALVVAPFHSHISGALGLLLGHQ